MSKKSLWYVLGGAIGMFCAHGIYTSNAKFYDGILMPIIRKMVNPETGHRIGLRLASLGVFGPRKITPREILKCSIWDLEFDSPIGLAAGFDKNGEAIDGLLNMGFSFVEIGSVTPIPQIGNSKPRVFRLDKSTAVINRYGLNNDGAQSVCNRLSAYKNSQVKDGQKTKRGIVGVNVAKNNEVPSDMKGDFIYCLRKFIPCSDYIAFNVSCPNVSNSSSDNLEDILSTIIKERDYLCKGNKIPVCLKISPDLTKDEFKSIAEIALKTKIDAIIISNTTKTRPNGIKGNKDWKEAGGLSGKPLCQLSLNALTEMYRLVGGRIKLIGVGGIMSGLDAYERIRHGANLVQIHTALAYSGPPVVETIKKDLESLIRNDGFTNVEQVIGIDVKLDD